MPKNKQRTPAPQPERQTGVPDLPGWAIHERPDPRPVLGSDDPAVWAAVEAASAAHERRIQAWCRSVGYRDQAEWNAAKAAERKAQRAAR